MKQETIGTQCCMLRRLAAWVSVVALTISLVSCVDSDSEDTASLSTGSSDAIAFATTVVSSRQASRADNTILNKGETTLPTGAQVGLFACYTGQHTWRSLVELSKKASPTEGEKKTLSTYYAANQLFNVPATATAGGALTYSPLAFWPNNELESSSAENPQHEYMTFWAYYPYNSTSSMGSYGISMTQEELGAGKGMGRVKFTMHPDASQQNDFLISAPVMDCNRDKYPLQRVSDTPDYAPKPVQLRLIHMLAQVRFYAFIRGDDKMVYQTDGSGNALLADEAWLATQTVGSTIMDAYGNVYTVKSVTKDGEGKVTAATIEQTTTEKADLALDEFVALKMKVPDETQCVRWDREGGVWDVTHSRRRANIIYQMELNNIRTTATFFPHYKDDGTVSIAVEEPTTLGSATVNHYIMNPYWFRFDEKGSRYQLNDTYMFGNYEDTPAARGENASDILSEDGIDWSSAAYTSRIASLNNINDPLHYLQGVQASQVSDLEHLVDGNKSYYNYYPGNILMVVPQTLSDDDVPHVVITAKGKITENGVKKDGSAKVTVNMLKMGLSWQSGFIYCYAFLDDLKPGDDKVRGPESITVLFNSNWYTDQW